MLSKDEHILLIAEKLFATKGYEATSTREISTEAKVNVSMISYYFGSKENLFKRIFEHRIKKSIDFTDEIMSREDYNEWQKIEKIALELIVRVPKYGDFFKLIQMRQVVNNNSEISQILVDSKLNYLKVYKKLIEDGYNKALFSYQPNEVYFHSTIMGTIIYAYNAKEVYRMFENANGNKVNDDDFIADLKIHIIDLLKKILGYNEK